MDRPHFAKFRRTAKSNNQCALHRAGSDRLPSLLCDSDDVLFQQTE
jgi:hypothetical protein